MEVTSKHPVELVITTGSGDSAKIVLTIDGNPQPAQALCPGAKILANFSFKTLAVVAPINCSATLPALKINTVGKLITPILAAEAAVKQALVRVGELAEVQGSPSFIRVEGEDDA